MRVWSERESDEKVGLKSALQRLNPSKSVLTERARAAQRAAANSNYAEELASAQREVKTRSIVVQDGLEAWPLPGLAPMTRVRTSFGDVHAAALRKGDEVLTRDGSYLRIQWLSRIQLDEHILNLKPDSNPVVLAAGALGPQLPSAEIMLSPRQIVCADGNTSLNRDREAAMLLSRPGVRRLRETALSYTVFHVGQTAEVYCEGLYLRFAMEA